MEHIGQYLDYEVFKNKDGLLEGFKSRGKKISLDVYTFTYSDHDRIVTPCKTPEEFVSYVSGLNKKQKVKKAKLPELPF